MNYSFVSVLMAAYNAEKYISEAINSILNQTYRSFEFIIINDGSTDSTEKIILSYSDSRIVYIRNEMNLKLIKSLNKGIDVAQGEYIVRMDADDIALPNLLESSINCIKEKNADIISIKTHYLSDDGSKVYRNNLNQIYESDTLKYILPFENCIGHPGTTIKTTLMKQYRYKDDGTVVHFEDVDLWNRMIAEGAKCYMLDMPLLLWRQNPQSITHSQTTEIVLNRWENYVISSVKSQHGYVVGEYMYKLFCKRNDFHINYSTIRKLEKDFNHYIDFLSKKYEISISTLNDLKKWRNFRIIHACFQDIAQHKNIVFGVYFFTFYLLRYLFLDYDYSIRKYILFHKRKIKLL